MVEADNFPSGLVRESVKRQCSFLREDKPLDEVRRPKVLGIIEVPATVVPDDFSGVQVEFLDAKGPATLAHASDAVMILEAS